MTPAPNLILNPINGNSESITVKPFHLPAEVSTQSKTQINTSQTPRLTRPNENTEKGKTNRLISRHNS